ncbi:MAG: hypothetical protein ACJZ4O_04450 [Pelagibacteraceae bacterium]
MNNYFKILLIFVIIIPLHSCGYKSVNKEMKYFINELNVNGNNRMGNELKQEIIFGSKDNNKNNINVSLNVEKSKQVKDRDSSGTITSYYLLVTAKINIKELQTSEKIFKSFIKSGSFGVGSTPSATIENEKKTTENLIVSLGEDINNFLNFYYIK